MNDIKTTAKEETAHRNYLRCGRVSGDWFGQKGASLIVVLIVLVIVSVLGLGAAQISMMSERGARNDRDRQVAWQAADAALMDAEFDVCGAKCAVVTNLGISRSDFFAPKSILEFREGCGSEGNSKGLCLPTVVGKPVWLTVDFESNTKKYAELGEFTGKTFASGGVGIQPAKKPAYVVEAMPDRQLFGRPTDFKYVYRVTAVGYGPREDIQVVTQMLFRKD